MKIDLSQFVGKDVKVTYKNGVERFGKVEVRDFLPSGTKQYRIKDGDGNTVSHNHRGGSCYFFSKTHNIVAIELVNIDLSQYLDKEVVVTLRTGHKDTCVITRSRDPLYPYLVSGYSYNANGQWKLSSDGPSTIIHIELLKPNPMPKYEQLQTEINELKALREKEDAKIKELEKEIESLKEEDMKNRLPQNFDRKAALHCIKTKNRLELAFLDWRSTPQGLDYWADIYHNRAPFTNAAIMQLQEWVIMSYQQEFEKE